MSFLSRLHRGYEHKSTSWHQSELYNKVSFSLRCVSMLQRMELLARARELNAKSDLRTARGDEDAIQSALNDLLVQRMYLEWGVVEIKGLWIDGAEANLDDLLIKGPEDLSEELFLKVQAQLGLTEAERKNS